MIENFQPYSRGGMAAAVWTGKALPVASLFLKDF